MTKNQGANNKMTADDKQKRKKILKRILIIAGSVIAGLIVIYIVLGFILRNVIASEGGNVHQREITDLPTITAFDADWGKKLDMPKVMYTVKDSGVVSLLEDIPKQDKHRGHRFFEKYFDILRRGDHKNYGDLFSNTYKKNPIGLEKNFDREFPPQELENVKVTELVAEAPGTYEGKDCVFGIYLVDYTIKENDCLFRNDFEHGKSRPLYFQLVTFNDGTKNEKTYIYNMYDEKSIEEHSEEQNG